VEEVVSDNPQLFHGWTQDEFDELYSRFGTGGALTEKGAVKAAQAMNKRRELLQRAALLMETNESELLETMIEALYSRAVVQSPENRTDRTRG
jgi:hypothetical protein